MNPKRANYILIAGFIISAGLLLFSAYDVNNLMKHQANNLTALKAKLAGLQQVQTSLNTDRKDITTYNSLYTIAQSVVPENKDQAQAVRQIINLANTNGVNVASITFPTSSLGNNVHSTTGVTPSVKPSGPSSSSNLSQLTAVPNIPGVYELPITVLSSTISGQETTYPQLIAFLKDLENNRLTALVSTINITPDQNNSNLFSFSIQLNIYIKPGSN